MFFEGSEKKVEVVVSSEFQGSLRDLGDSFWAELVSHAKAQVISKVESESLSAYLLSESSLFVWDKRFTLITCGVTQLVKAVDFFLKQFEARHLLSIIFERKNEFMPEEQFTDFQQDIQLLNTHLKGQAFQFGQPDKRHLYLYHMDQPFNPPTTDMTLEVLMYDIQGEAKEVFSKTYQTKERLNQQMPIHQVIEGFQKDDFAFEPNGYSLNAIKEAEYMTYHVTPQDRSSYVSFETNHQTSNYQQIVQNVVRLFNPKFFEVVIFRAGEAEHIAVDSYHSEQVITKELKCGYDVHYFQFHENHTTPMKVEEAKKVEI